MKNKAIIFAAVIILLTRVVSVSASNDHSNEHSVLGESNRVDNQQDNKNSKKSLPTSAQVSPTGITALNNEEDSDCDDNVKNHGAFVSCVAREHLGGDSVSEAAHLDTGKKDDIDDDEDDISPTVTPIASASPTITPTETITPTASESPTVTPTTTITPEQEQGLLDAQIKGLIDQLKNFIISLTSLLS